MLYNFNYIYCLFYYNKVAAPVSMLSLSSFNIPLHVVAYVGTLFLLVVSIAFFTVLERKLLAAMQRRSGPNMSSM